MYVTGHEASNRYAVREIACIRYTDDTMTVIYKDGTMKSLALDDVREMAFATTHVDDVADNIGNVAANAKAEVYDINGRLVRSDVESLPAGVYIIRRNGVTSKIVR